MSGRRVVADTLPTGTVTLLLADLEDSVGLWERGTALMTSAMSRVDELVAHAVEEHAGACPVEQREGDSFVLVFSRASDAVGCALDLQRAFADEPWPGRLRLRFRMALHTGEVGARGERQYVGPALNRCARLRNLGQGGQTLLSQVTHGLVADHLPEGVVLRSLGEHGLRGMSRPEIVYQLAHNDLDGDFPPLRSTRSASGNLPAPMTSFVGRRAELAEVDRLLGRTRVLTLLGAGGIGKTRLALEAAAAVREHFDDGAWWVDLAPLTDADLLVPTLATTLDIHAHVDEAPIDAVVRTLSAQRVLLVLDNCEHLVRASAELVSALVHGCPGMVVLATSREPLGVNGETSLRVASLDVPASSDDPVDQLAGTDAVRLFVDRARDVQPGFRLTDRNAPAVATICRRLDGIPLAVELAAARVRLLSPGQVAAGLSDRFRLLTGGPRTALPRQRTLEASVAWSHDLLSREEQLVLARLSVFAGTFDLDGVAGVCTDDTLDADAVLDLLTGLVDRSLVQVAQRGGSARYRLLETIRVFVRQQLDVLDDPARVRDRHLAHYHTLTEQAQIGLYVDPDSWLQRLTAEVDDLRASMAWAMASDVPLVVIDFAERIYTFWMVRGLYAEMHQRLEKALTSPALQPDERARGHRTASVLALMGGDYPAGFEFADRAVTLSRQIDAPDVRAHAHLNRAWTGYFSGRASDDMIRSDFDTAGYLIASLDDEPLRIRSWMYEGWIEANRCSLPDGLALLEQTVDAARSASLVHLQVPALAFLAGTRAQVGQFDRAREHCVEAIELGRTLQFDAFVSVALGFRAGVETFAGNETEARQAVTEARAVAQRAGLKAFDLYALRMQAWIEAFFGDPVAADDAATELMSTLGPSMRGKEEAFGHWLAGTAALRVGDHPRARANLEAGRDRAGDPSYPSQLGRCLLGLSHLATAESDVETAWELAHNALDVLATWGDPVGSADALEAIAALALTTGSSDKAARLLGGASRVHEDTGARRMRLEADLHAATLASAQRELGDDDFETAHAGGAALSLEDAVTYARRGRGKRGRPPAGWQSLTSAELDVVRLLAQGLRNAEIAERLFVTVNTVKTHLSHVYTKLDVKGRADLAAEAVRRDL